MSTFQLHPAACPRGAVLARLVLAAMVTPVASAASPAQGPHGASVPSTPRVEPAPVATAMRAEPGDTIPILARLGVDGDWTAVGSIDFDSSRNRASELVFQRDVAPRLGELELVAATRGGLLQLARRGELLGRYAERLDGGAARVRIASVPVWDESGWRTYIGPVPVRDVPPSLAILPPPRGDRDPVSFPPIPGVSSFEPNDGLSGGLLTLEGVHFPSEPLDACIQVLGGGLIAPIDGDPSFITGVLLPSLPDALPGPIQIMTGHGSVIDDEDLPPFPFISNPSLRIWSGSMSGPGSVTTAEFDLSPNPNFRPFVPAGAFAPGPPGIKYTVTFPDECPEGTMVSIWGDICANGQGGEMYFLDPDTGEPNTTILIPTDLNGNLCALYVCATLSAAWEDVIDGFTCDVVDGTTIEIYVDQGGGIDCFTGGILIQAPCDPTLDDNEGFELGNFTGYTVAGVAAVVGDFMGLAPPEGTLMAQLSTQPFAGSGSLSFDVDLPSGASTLRVTLNILTHEIPFCAGCPIDEFYVDVNGQQEFSFSVDDLTDDQANCTWQAGPGFYCMTGFVSLEMGVTDYAGTTAHFELGVTDPDGVDDGVDTTVLLDDIRFTCN